MSTSQPLAGLHHMSMRVPDMEKSLRFYRETLGLTLKTAFILDEMRFAMLDTGNGTYLELVEIQQPVRAAGEREVFWHLALRTTDLDKAMAAVEKAGCTIVVPIRPLSLRNDVTGQSWPIRVGFFLGPDGELIELLEDRTGQT